MLELHISGEGGGGAVTEGVHVQARGEQGVVGGGVRGAVCAHTTLGHQHEVTRDVRQGEVLVRPRQVEQGLRDRVDQRVGGGRVALVEGLYHQRDAGGAGSTRGLGGGVGGGGLTQQQVVLVLALLEGGGDLGDAGLRVGVLFGGSDQSGQQRLLHRGEVALQAEQVQLGQVELLDGRLLLGLVHVQVGEEGQVVQVVERGHALLLGARVDR